MVNGKQYQLSPQASDNTEFDNSRAVSVRDFKILRQKTAEDGAKLQASITVNAEEIALRATKTYVDGQDANLESAITVNAEAITLRATKTYVDGIKANLEASITVNADAIALKASQSDLNSLGTRVTTAESTLTVQADQIATKVSTTDLNTALSNYSTITQTADSISTYVGTNVYTKAQVDTTLGDYATTDYVTTNYSTITQTADAIATRVATTDYTGNEIASRINQTATTIQLDASKINLSGYVTVTALGQAGATTINGSNITTGTLSANLITAGSMSVDRLTVGSVSGWYFGASSISRQNITLGANSISLGGTGTADATINFGTTPCRIYNYNGTDTIGVSHQLRVNGLLYASGGLFVNGESNLGTTLPSSDNSRNLGSNIRRWIDVWAVDGTINTSDKTDKKDIKILDTSVEFIKALKPVKFKWKNGKRNHMGFLTQDVKQAMDATIGDAGLFIDPSVDGSEGSQGLRYHEFISPMVSTLQNILSRLEALENARTL